MRHQLVQPGDGTATLVLSGTVSSRDVSSMRRACREIPVKVRTLRLNLGDVEGLDARVIEAVRGVVSDWRTSRGGNFRLDLTTPHLVARMEERRPTP
jgi:hypothetical protein